MVKVLLLLIFFVLIGLSRAHGNPSTPVMVSAVASTQKQTDLNYRFKQALIDKNLQEAFVLRKIIAAAPASPLSVEAAIQASLFFCEPQRAWQLSLDQPKQKFYQAVVAALSSRKNGARLPQLHRLKTQTEGALDGLQTWRLYNDEIWEDEWLGLHLEEPCRIFPVTADEHVRKNLKQMAIDYFSTANIQILTSDFWLLVLAFELGVELPKNINIDLFNRYSSDPQFLRIKSYLTKQDQYDEPLKAKQNKNHIEISTFNVKARSIKELPLEVPLVMRGTQ